MPGERAETFRTCMTPMVEGGDDAAAVDVPAATPAVARALLAPSALAMACPMAIPATDPPDGLVALALDVPAAIPGTAAASL